MTAASPLALGVTVLRPTVTPLGSAVDPRHSSGPEGPNENSPIASALGTTATEHSSPNGTTDSRPKTLGFVSVPIAPPTPGASPAAWWSNTGRPRLLRSPDQSPQSSPSQRRNGLRLGVVASKQFEIAFHAGRYTLLLGLMHRIPPTAVPITMWSISGQRPRPRT